MSFSAFPHAHGRPTDEEVSSALGESRLRWSRTLARLAAEFGEVRVEWRSYGRVSGWSLNVKDRHGTLAYLYPQRGGFILVVTVGHEAVARAASGELPAGVAEAIARSRPYAKGYSVATDVCGEQDLRLVLSLCRLRRQRPVQGGIARAEGDPT
jgi:hypothetical protein